MNRTAAAAMVADVNEFGVTFTAMRDAVALLDEARREHAAQLPCAPVTEIRNGDAQDVPTNEIGPFNPRLADVEGPISDPQGLSVRLPDAAAS